MTHGSLFSGIGGFDLAAEWMGWKNLFHCEWNEFGQKVLNYYWPDAELFTDITKSDFTKYANKIDVLSGGFPCQPYSHAGKRLGKEDERHLWPEMLRAIREIQPTWVVGENVSGLISWNGGLVFHEVQTDLEAEGYEVQPFVLPAASVGAPHRRDRVWFIAYANHKRNSAGFGGIQKENGEISEWNNDAKFGNSGFGTTANPAIKGRKEWEPNNGRTDSAEDSAGLDDRFERLSGKWPITNTCKYGFDTFQWIGQPEMCGICEDGDNYQADDEADWGDASDTYSAGWDEECEPATVTSKPQRQYSETDIRSKPGGWENFPTQPPVCSRNDGLSNRLDGITFSKWRNESIKAYGNAIVPQVAFQIFKAIMQMP